MADVRRVTSDFISATYAFCALRPPSYLISNHLLGHSSELKLSALFHPLSRTISVVFGFYHHKRLSALLAFSPSRVFISGQAIVVHILVSVVTPWAND